MLKSELPSAGCQSQKAGKGKAPRVMRLDITVSVKMMLIL